MATALKLMRRPWIFIYIGGRGGGGGGGGYKNNNNAGVGQDSMRQSLDCDNKDNHGGGGENDNKTSAASAADGAVGEHNRTLEGSWSCSKIDCE